MQTCIIDDDNISVYLTKHILRLAGISDNITSFLSAEKALDFLKQHVSDNLPELIFLDLNMPVMNGWEFLEALSPYEQQLTGKCHIYILTSSLDLSDTVRAKDYAMVSGLIHKPLNQVDVQVILSQIEEEK